MSAINKIYTQLGRALRRLPRESALQRAIEYTEELLDLLEQLEDESDMILEVDCELRPDEGEQQG